MTISQVLASSLISTNVVYDLENIYDIVQRNASNISLDDDWKHNVRGILSYRKVGNRVITYHGNAQYSFN